MIGESPTRPGIFHASPLVVVVPDISPLAFSARQLIVPVGGWIATSHAQASVSSSACGNSFFISATVAALAGAVSRPGPQLLCPAGSFKDRFQVNHSRRD